MAECKRVVDRLCRANEQWIKKLQKRPETVIQKVNHTVRIRLAK
jgi:hypothetical protein